MSFRTAPLSELSEKIVVGHVGPSSSHRQHDGIPFLMGKNVGEGFLRLDDLERVTPEFHAGQKKSQLSPGDVVVVRIGKSGLAAKVPEELGDANCAGLVVVKGPREVTADYLVHYLNSPAGRRQSLKQTKGSTRQTLNTKSVAATAVPVPPLSEQWRIAAILDAADELRAKRRESIAQLVTLIRSVCIDMFGDPVTNPKGWKRQLLGEVTSIHAPMVDPTTGDYRGLLHYGPDRIESATGELLPAQTAEEDGVTSGKFLCTPGEVLYSKIRPYLNKVALVKQRCLCSADVYPVMPLPDALTKEYLWVLLRSQSFLDYVAGFSRRASIPKLNRQQFAGYDAPVPTLDLQRRFAVIVGAIEQQKQRLRAHQAELGTLFASIQSRAFRGDL